MNPLRQRSGQHATKPQPVPATFRVLSPRLLSLAHLLYQVDDRQTVENRDHDLTKPGAQPDERIAVAPAGAGAGGGAAAAVAGAAEGVRLVEYEDERQLSDIMSLVDRDLSEPYSIFTYRYFLHNWPGLCFVVREEERKEEERKEEERRT